MVVCKVVSGMTAIAVWGPLLAAANQDKSSLWDVALYGIIVLGAVLLLVFVAQWYRARFREEEESEPTFTLADLRELRDRGQLAPDEYERLRGIIVTEVREQAERGSQP